MTDATWKINDISGEEMTLTLTYHTLYMLRESGADSREVFDTYSKIRMDGANSELEQAYIVYTAYCCAHLSEPLISFVDFLKRMPADRSLLIDTINWLLEPAKKKALLQRALNAPHGKADGAQA